MRTFDFLVVGTGFSGSIIAMALTKMGYSVCLVEENKHPRFTIGESSTPIADMILRDLADEYGLPFLKKISRYGEWQKHFPEVTCGLKRGFSYYYHQKGERFITNENHNRELLVAASENDQNSDTNWLRSDVDHFLVNKAAELGITYFDQTNIQNLSRDPQGETWSVFMGSQKEVNEIKCSWIIDATGSSHFSTKFFNTQSNTNGFQTYSSAIYSHFEKVDHWYEYLESNGFKTSDYPYNPDYSALHHLIDEGWIWMLRFKNDRLSAGILLDEVAQNRYLNMRPDKIWSSIIHQYPSLCELFYSSELAASPNQIFSTRRLQRKLNRVYGNGWVVLPHTAGFVDPLHSTGIAFTLNGVETLLKIFQQKADRKSKKNRLKNYQDKIYKELSVIDLLVSICYKTRKHFDLFSSCTMLYFIASIRYEQSRLSGNIPDTYLCAGNPEINEIIQVTFQEIQQLNVDSMSESDIKKVVKKIRKRIEPFNSLGLMNPDLNNMYTHTAVEL